MRALISMSPYLVGTAQKPKLDGWLLTLTIGSAKPMIVRNDTEKAASNALRKAISDYVVAGYTVEAKVHDRQGALIEHATYANKRGQIERTEHKIAAKRVAPAAAAQERLDRPRASGKGQKKGAGRRWTAKKAAALADTWKARDPKGAAEFLAAYKRGEWSDADCDKAEKVLRPKKPTSAANQKKPAAGEKLEAAAAKPKAAAAQPKKGAGKKQAAKRQPSELQVKHQAFMSREIKRLVASGVNNKEAMKRAAAAWRAKKG